MKKKFISVAMLCTLAISAPLFVGCSDYDDDISNLQSQIDGLKGSNITTEEAKAAVNEAITALKQELTTAIDGKANNSAVIELQQKATELSDALNGKADSQTVADLASQVQSLIEQVNNVEGTLDQTKKDLEQKLTELQKAYEAADKQLSDAIAMKADADAVTSLQNKLTTVEGDLLTAINDLNAIKAENNASKIAELTKQITNLTNQYNTIASDLANKADKTTVDELNNKLSDIEANLINYVNKSEVESLKNDLKELETELTKRPTSAEVTAEITNKIEALGELVNVNVFNAYKAEIENRLGDITSDISENSTQLNEVKELAEENGQNIVDLTNRINSLEDILAGFESQPGGDISETVLGQIVALSNRVDAIDGENGALAVLENKYNTLNSEIAKMQQKLSETELNALRDIAKWDNEKNGSIVSVLEQVIELKNALNATAEEGEKFDLSDIADQLNSLQNQLDQLGLMSKMIQSIVFVPTFEDNGTEVVADKRVGFKTLQLWQNGTPNGYWKTFVQNKEQTVQFRVSPATLTKEDFESRYAISFYGSMVSTRSAVNVLTNVKVESLEDGLLTLKVTSGENVDDDYSYKAWAMTARVTPKNDVEGNETFTDLFSDYFIVDNSVDRLNNIKVQTAESGKVSPYEIEYSDKTTSINFAQDQKLIGVTSSGTNIDLSQEYPAFTANVTYELSGDKDYFNWTDNTISLNKEIVNQSAIGRSVNVTAKVTVSGSNQTYTTTFQPVQIVKATPEYSVTGVNTSNWFVGADQKIYTVSDSQIREIMYSSDMTESEFWNTVATGTADGLNGDVYFKANGRSIEIWQKGGKNISGGTITFKFNTDATGNEFTLKASINAMTDNQYPKDEITKDAAAWNGDTIGLLPHDNNVLVTLKRDLTTVFENYSTVANSASDKGATLSFRIYVNNVLNGSYLNNDGKTLVVNPTTYRGENLKFELIETFGSKEFVIASGNVSVQDLSGSWVINKTETFDPQHRTLNSTSGINLAEGFEWQDYVGNTMWKDGSASNLSKYALTAPTFKIISGNTQYITLSGGMLNFTSGTENNFQTAHTVIIEVNAKSNWGTIAGYNNQTKTITVTIPAGTYTR